jgi:tRNA pseudouridine55 synthase
MTARIRKSINGILLLNKPIGISSNQALTEVKKLYCAKKAGHTGSLDPLARGMLPVCFGEATKFSQHLLEADKEYYVEAKLGIRTATGDAEGEIVSTRDVAPGLEATMEQVLDNFRGEISQVPSMYSALKHKGKPLYSYARQGIEIERESRTVTIRELTLHEYKDDHLAMSVRCSKGTYIRTLIEDIGEMLGCGAYVTTLYRTYVDPYHEEDMITLDDLADLDPSELEKLLLPIDSALSAWPQITLTESLTYYIKQGQPIIVPKAPPEGLVRLMSNQQTFLGTGEILDDGRVAPRRLVAV